MNDLINKIKKTIKKLCVFYLLMNSVIVTILLYDITYVVLLDYYEKTSFINCKVFNLATFLLLIFLAAFSILAIIVWFAHKSIDCENVRIEENNDER